MPVLGITSGDIEAIVGAYHSTPFRVLGPHSGGDSLVIRVYVPGARQVTVVEEGAGNEYPTQQAHSGGFFTGTIAGRTTPFPYLLRITDDANHTYERHDPYAFPLQLTEFDLHLIGEGRHYHTYEKLGAHLREVEGIGGVNFAVWAPNAERVSVVGNFNQWDGRVCPMQLHEQQGLWELFIPDLQGGEVYKYEVKSRQQGYLVTKSDPYGFGSEFRPQTASVVVDLDHFEWSDTDWVTERPVRQALDKPLAIYEVHLGSWRRKPEEGSEDTVRSPISSAQHAPTGRYLTYRELAAELIPYVKELGYTHIELLPIAEHPFDGSWGYQVTGYYAPTSRHGSPLDFMYFIDRCHANGIGVLLDWVPAHFPKDEHGLNYFDGTHLYEYADSRLGEHKLWGTLVFNYGRNEVRNFLLSNALFWLDKYHLDGLRVDAVAAMLYLNYGRKEGEWVQNRYGGSEHLEAVEFLKQMNLVVQEYAPGALTIAEESTSWPLVTHSPYIGGLGFSLKWNMGWMHDMLDYMKLDPIHRRYHHNKITFSMLYAFSEKFVLPFSHDEVVHLKGSLLTKMPGDEWQKFANLRLLYGYMYGHPGKKLLFMGGEFGQWQEWGESRSLDWPLATSERHQQLQRYIQDLHHLYQTEKALYEEDFSWGGFSWIDASNAEQSIIAFIRRAKDPRDLLVCVCNFTPIIRYNYRIGVPHPGYYRELLNSDAALYSGSNVGNSGGVYADPTSAHGHGHSLSLTLPPLAVLIFKGPPHLPY